jgi:Immunity protein Imm6
MATDMDIFNNPTLLEDITIRARAAYYVAVAESVFAAAPPDDGSLDHGRVAMNMAWQWIEGVPVTAYDLDWQLENEDTGLISFPSDTCAVVGTALAYVIWQAYRAEGAKRMPQTIGEYDESVIVGFHRLAENTKVFDHQLARRLLNYLQASYATSQTDELGSPILRRDVASGANIEIPEEVG